MLCSECGDKVTRAKAKYRKTMAGDVRVVCEYCDVVLQAIYEGLRKDKNHEQG